MAVQIGDKKQASFDRPLEMLSDCHRRIERFLAALLTVTQRKNGAELDALETEALRSALEYFRTSGPRHTADEEESLFPRMKNCAAASEAFERIRALQSDHETADRAHAEVALLGQRWLDRGKLDGDDARRMGELLETLSRLYKRHIDIEDREIFPIAERKLPASDIAGIGDEMARRRGLR